MLKTKFRSRVQNFDILVLNETNRSPGDEVSLGLKLQAGMLSNTPIPERTGAGFGTFIGSRLWDANLGDSLWRHDCFEIVRVTRKYKGLSVGIIGFYRSPNMDAAETDAFYKSVGDVISKEVGNDVLLLMGDDNSHPDGKSASAKRAFRQLELIRSRYKGVHVVEEPTRGIYQPDHVVGL